MDWQHLVTAVLVAGSAAYALRALWPALARRAGLGGAASAGACGGGCSGCGSAASKPADPSRAATGESVIRIVRRAPTGSKPPR